VQPQPQLKTCPPGKHWGEDRLGCVTNCPPGKVPNAKGDTCLDVVDTDANANANANQTTGDVEDGCPAGTEWSESRSVCVPICPAGRVLDVRGTSCVAVSGSGSGSAKAKSCPPGKEWRDAWGGCVPACPPDQVLDFKGVACHPIRLQRRGR
jgi:hypothetical protein